MKTTWAKIRNIMSWVIMFAMIFLLIFTVMNTINARKNNESAFLFGYRPVLVLTGSMEPYMMTNSIALTKEVTDIDQLEVDDVVTYHLETEEGRILRITHRIIAIDGENIYTKGDNNFVDDGYPLTIDNIEAKVIAVFNQTAWIAQKWQTTAGKVMIISFSAGLIFLYFLVRYSWEDRKARKAISAEESAADPEIEQDMNHEESKPEE